MPPKKKKLSRGPPGCPPKVLPKDPPIRPPPPKTEAETDPQDILHLVDQYMPLFKMLKDQMNGLGKILENMQQKRHLLKLVIEVMKIDIRAAGGIIEEDDDDKEVDDIERMTVWAVDWWNDNLPRISELNGVDLLALVKECVDEEVARYNMARSPPAGKESKVEIVETEDALILYTEGREIITIPKGLQPSELGVVTKPEGF